MLEVIHLSSMHAVTEQLEALSTDGGKRQTRGKFV